MRKINFLQLGRYGRCGEQRYRQTFRKDFDWLCFSTILVAVAAFSNLPFVKGLKEIGFSLVNRLRSSAVLYYVYEGPRTGKRGRAKTKDEKIDFANSDKSRMTPLDIAPENGEAFPILQSVAKMSMTFTGHGSRLSSVSVRSPVHRIARLSGSR